MESMKLYERVRAVPESAIKTIRGGRINGMSDINPMWRIKTLTEQFGPCGVGWKYIIREKRLEKGAGEEIAAFVDIDLYYRHEGQWSEAVPGTGGSSFVAKESKGLYTSDECFKMALTDAISVACKALGMGADVYWNGDKTKYDGKEEQAFTCNQCGQAIKTVKKGERRVAPDEIKKSTGGLCLSCYKAQKERGHAE